MIKIQCIICGYGIKNKVDICEVCESSKEDRDCFLEEEQYNQFDLFDEQKDELLRS
jgi:hypothetical protein